ncbi:Crp/Fnr family transcriptional regulator [Mucilaginibacter paludis]|uniref:Transcriptional regulator, Crp/Fnr family n=1 Tax=Mucilaginibacter paludis DSM 18603 TaxID=714943 RepID=H1Y286_9SPHI|nr:Crp/Fnr family transcriptional regulator [Mucilaginibacter paludis]EHQ27866.1 putative transcriptional regulator, Crp/Fnr family [Mucilaginibacter paludis DSM 18603]
MYELILTNFAMHINLDTAETELIKAELQHKAVKKNSILLHAGAICRNVYFVNKGCLRVFNTDKEGEEHNVLFCPENWWAVDIASFSEQTPAFYTIGALEDTEVFYLSYHVLEKLYTEVPKLERFFRILVQNGFYLYQRRTTLNLSKTAKERYELFEKQYPKLEQRIAQKHIASYLGITPVFLSIIRKT